MMSHALLPTTRGAMLRPPPAPAPGRPRRTVAAVAPAPRSSSALKMKSHRELSVRRGSRAAASPSPSLWDILPLPPRAKQGLKEMDYFGAGPLQR